ncbi:hypothetical protein [Streptomyces sp. NPDC058145]|uniref:hypothetical protein n=1 Tax=Streptomyces sp. NPDC058145 TaxID=3346356 RepID=UPI0036E530B1
MVERAIEQQLPGGTCGPVEEVDILSLLLTAKRRLVQFSGPGSLAIARRHGRRPAEEDQAVTDEE